MICLGDSEQQYGITWQAVDPGTVPGTAYKPTYNANTSIETLNFNYNGSTSNSGSGSTYTVEVAQTGTSLTLNSNGKALQMGDSGTGTLNINFGSQKNANTFFLDLSQVTNTDGTSYAFKGNITTSGTNYANTRYFKAIFGANVKGNITLNSGGKATGADSTPDALTFNNGAKLEGNLSVGYEDTSVVFNESGGLITGNLSKTSSGSFNLTFSNGGSIGSSLTSGYGVNVNGNNGNINFYTGSNSLTIHHGIYIQSTGNTLTFNGTNIDIQGNITTPNSSSGGTIFDFTATDNATIHLGTIFSQYNANGLTFKIASNNANLTIDTLKNNKGNGVTINFNGANNTLTWDPKEGGATGGTTINFTSGTSNVNKIYAKQVVNSIYFKAETTTNTIKGNIQADYTGTNKVYFQGTSATNEVQGSIFANTGSNTVQFSGTQSTVTNGISVSGNGGSNNVTFSTATNQVGAISATATSANNGGSSTNTILFDTGSQDNTTGAINASTGSYSTTITNNVTFSGSGNNTINGNITASATDINSAATVAKNIIAFTQGTNSINGVVQASGGTNSITFAGTSHSITGGVLANQFMSKIDVSNTINATSGDLNIGELSGNFSDYSIVASGTRNTNSITLTTGSLIVTKGVHANTVGGYKGNTIEAQAGSITIQSGGVWASGSGNTISASTSISITGNIYINAGSNAITLTGNGTTSISGNITANNGSNLISTSSATSNTLTGASITASGGGKNILALNTISSGTQIIEIRASSGDGDQNHLKNTANILSLDNLTSPTTITITDINKQTTIGSNKTGYNYIGKDLTTGDASGRTLALSTNFTDSTWSDNTYQASQLTLNVTNNIYTSKGRNYINVGAISIGGDLIADTTVDNEGRNNLATAGTFSVSNITTNRGTNAIIVGSNTTVSGDITNNGGANTLTFNGANATHSVSGNITANAGSNTLNFAGSDSTFSMTEDSSTLSIGGNGNNTFNIQGDTKVTSNLIAQRSEENATGKNIFNISNAKSLTLSDSNSTAKTLTTNSGATEINFLGDSNGSSGTFSGNVSTSGGTTTFSFTNDNGTYSITGTLSTQGEGQNIFDLSTKSATISNDLSFSGSDVTGDGGNIINIGASKTLTMNSNNNGSITTNSGETKINFEASGSLNGGINTTGGTSTINLVDNAQATISKAVTNSASTIANIANSATLVLSEGITTTAETSTINFNGESGTLNGNISTTGGTTIFNLGSNDSNSATATITGTLTNNTNATNTFNVNAKTTTFKYGSGNNNDGLVFSNGTNNINFANTSGATLNWRSNASNSDVKNTNNSDIKTTGGITNINFNHNGTLASGISTSNSGVTNINLYEDSKGIINSSVTAQDSGQTNITFNSSNASLSLLAKDNHITTLSSNGSNNSIILAQLESSKGLRINTRDTSLDSNDSAKITNNFSLLTIDSLKGEAINFIMSINTQTNTAESTLGGKKQSDSNSYGYAYSDRIIINNNTQASDAKTHTITLKANSDLDIKDISAMDYQGDGTNKEGNIAVATIKEGSNISFIGGISAQGAGAVDISLVTDKTDQYGKTNSTGGYLTYFIGTAKIQSVTQAIQQASAAALGSNYDLYLANMNSLNKRMGELRENANAQG
ncbi:hypothetical protein CQA57_02905, partial [Helicobacter anseris]